jgi:hypothetical protein
LLSNALANAAEFNAVGGEHPSTITSLVKELPLSFELHMRSRGCCGNGERDEGDGVTNIIVLVRPGSSALTLFFRAPGAGFAEPTGVI